MIPLDVHAELHRVSVNSCTLVAVGVHAYVHTHILLITSDAQHQHAIPGSVYGGSQWKKEHVKRIHQPVHAPTRVHELWLQERACASLTHE